MSPSIQSLLAPLDRHTPHDADETRGLLTLRAFVCRAPEPLRRSTLEGHLTGSAVVVDPRGRALLLHHARLGLWVQPGGHIDDTETEPAAAALREAIEETGLSDLVLDADEQGPRLFDVDVHPIPASEKRGEPAHFHYDLCYLARTRAADEARIAPDESHAMRWVGPEDLDSLTLDTATRRRLEKAFRLFSGRDESTGT